MKIGNLEIKNCNQCPAHRWQGENTSQGDQGCRCEFGAFFHCFREKQIPKECPWRVMKDEIKRLDAEVARLRGIIEGLECDCQWFRDRGEKVSCQACRGQGEGVPG